LFEKEEGKMIEIDVERLENSIILHLSGKATIETARELKANILSCIPDTQTLVIDAESLSHGDISFFQIVISAFRDMVKLRKQFAFFPSEPVKRDASLLFGDFSLVCELLGMDPAKMREILLGERDLAKAIVQPA
jgi:anti-anti-sigma regulatory factor